MQWDETITPDVTTMKSKSKISNSKNEKLNLYLAIYKEIRTISPEQCRLFEQKEAYLYKGDNTVSLSKVTVGNIIDSLLDSPDKSPYFGQSIFWTSYVHTKGNLNTEISRSIGVLSTLFQTLRPRLSLENKSVLDSLVFYWEPINYITADVTMDEDFISYEPVTNILEEESEDSITYEAD